MTHRARCRSRALEPLSFVGLALALTAAVCAPAPTLAEVFETGAVHVRLAPGVPVSTVNSAHGTATIDSLPPMYILSLPPGSIEEEMLAEFLADPLVLQAELAWKSETPEGVRQMVVAAVGGTIDDYLDQRVVERLRLTEIQAQTRGMGVIVAVLDTGVDLTHPAIAEALEPGGWDFVDNDGDPLDTANLTDDDQDGLIDEAAGHGTMVAGIIHLVAPEARILPIRILNDEGIGRSFDVAKGIRYAVEHGAQVINMSLGMLTHTFVITNEIADADTMSVSLVSGAGNLSAENPAYFPGSDWRVFCVAALDSNDVKADFSNWNLHIEVSAPGVGIMAPYYDGGYAIGAGTSFAAPFIAGQVALIRALRPELTTDQVRRVVELGVVDIYSIPENEPYTGALGAGRFDGIETLAAASTLGVRPDGPIDRGEVLVSPNPATFGRPVVIQAPIGTLGCVTIHDVQGRTVRDLGALAPGNYGFTWDGCDEVGKAVPAGIYLIRIRTEAGEVHGRVLTLK